jgi:multidrug resistance efflux pump
VKEAALLAKAKQNRVNELIDQGFNRSEIIRIANKEFDQLEKNLSKQIDSIGQKKKSLKDFTPEEAQAELQRRRGG